MAKRRCTWHPFPLFITPLSGVFISLWLLLFDLFYQWLNTTLNGEKFLLMSATDVFIVVVWLCRFLSHFPHDFSSFFLSYLEEMTVVRTFSFHFVQTWLKQRYLKQGNRISHGWLTALLTDINRSSKTTSTSSAVWQVPRAVGLKRSFFEGPDECLLQLFPFRLFALLLLWLSEVNSFCSSGSLKNSLRFPVSLGITDAKN